MEGQYGTVTAAPPYTAHRRPLLVVSLAIGWVGEWLMATTVKDDVQVLTFQLGDETCCVDFEHVAEVIDRERMVLLPTDEPYVTGITLHRGETTTIVALPTILERTDTLSTDTGKSANYIILLDSDTVGTEGVTGWLVSNIQEVTELPDGKLETDSPKHIYLLRGRVTDDGRSMLWLDCQEFTAWWVRTREFNQ